MKNRPKEWWLIIRKPYTHPIRTNVLDWGVSYTKSDRRHENLFDDQNVLLKNVVLDNRQTFNINYVTKVLNNV